MYEYYLLGTTKNSEMIAPFTASRLEYGWLGNMSHYPCMHNGIEYRTAEHLFQSLRFMQDEDTIQSSVLKEVIRQINKETNAYKAKQVAKHWAASMVVTPLSEHDIRNMETTINAKIRTNMEILAEEFHSVKNKYIVEDVSQRLGNSSLFWGAALIGDRWIGANVVGKVWNKLLRLHFQNSLFNETEE